MLTNSDLVELTEFRRALHQKPEVSGEEVETAGTVVSALRQLSPSRILTGLGGHGVAALFDSGKPGPTVLFRAELDGLPIEELSDAPWRSQIPGKGHLCGHDGHMTMLLALGRLLSRKPIASGRVVLMFQPAEEDGSGARAVVADPAFAEIAPDWAFAIHNEPGRAFGYVSTRAGLINCASRGLAIKLSGKTAHAANPEDGLSPARTVSDLIPALSALGTGGALDDTFRLATVTHARIGEATFGIAPGDAIVHVTLRTARDEAMEDMATEARSLAEGLAQRDGLAVSFEVRDDFAASINDAEATVVAVAAMNAVGVANGDDGLPMRASEDFGVFGWGAKAAMLCLGPGEDHAALHNPDYDFPDDLIPIGAAIFDRIARDLLG
ncbi:amidohydrolase [Primorskyibacter sedentarius]|uniref:Amidohydrolase n=1 Tax=Primorskyibacter sedentarius TaxID=745311 RepID=A0A4R3J9W4_9RHOB|nr:amidohydrolase [Primorskyibacter sedentarius]TCS62317.1 amidohydrolase [Primorskyibacter sedentarius]